MCYYAMYTICIYKSYSFYVRNKLCVCVFVCLCARVSAHTCVLMKD